MQTCPVPSQRPQPTLHLHQGLPEPVGLLSLPKLGPGLSQSWLWVWGSRIQLLEVQGLLLEQAPPTLTGWLLEAGWALPQTADCLAWDGQMWVDTSWEEKAQRTSASPNPQM